MTDSAASVSGQGMSPQRKQTPEIEGQKGAMGLSRQVTPQPEEETETFLIEEIPTKGVPQTEPQNVEVQKAESGRATPIAEKEELPKSTEKPKIPSKAAKLLGMSKEDIQQVATTTSSKVFRTLGMPMQKAFPDDSVSQALQKILHKAVQDDKDGILKIIDDNTDVAVQMREFRKLMETHFTELFEPDINNENYAPLYEATKGIAQKKWQAMSQLERKKTSPDQMAIDEEARYKFVLREEYMDRLGQVLPKNNKTKNFLADLTKMRVSLHQEEEFLLKEKTGYLGRMHLIGKDKLRKIELAPLNKYIDTLLAEDGYFKGDIEEIRAFVEWNKDDTIGAIGDDGYKHMVARLDEAQKRRGSSTV